MGRSVAKRAGAVAAVVAVIVGVLAPARPDDAIIARLASNRRMPADQVHRPIVSIALDMEAGESRVVIGRLQAKSNTTGNVLQSARIGCNGRSGIRTNRNHEGRDAYTSLALYVRTLWTAPGEGAYTCTLFGYAKRAWRAPEGSALTALAGKTYLSALHGDRPGAAMWGTRTDQHRDSNGRIQIGPGQPAGRAEWVLRRIWTAPEGATHIDVIADAELTNCNRGTNSCPERAWGPAGVKDSVALTRLKVVQLGEDNRPCMPARWYPSRREKGTRIGFNAHHVKVYHGLRAPISEEDACTRDFAIALRARWWSGNPFQINNSTYTNAIGAPLPFNAPTPGPIVSPTI